MLLKYPKMHPKSFVLSICFSLDFKKNILMALQDDLFAHIDVFWRILFRSHICELFNL